MRPRFCDWFFRVYQENGVMLCRHEGQRGREASRTAYNKLANG